MNLISLFITALLTENVVLTKFLGLCPFMGVSNKEESAFGMGLSVMLIVTISSIVTYGLYHLVLVPADATYLTNIIFIFVIAAFVQILEILLKKFIPNLYKSFGLYLPLITTNCAVLGIVLLNINNNYNFIQMLIFSIGSSLGFTLVIYLFGTIREEIARKPIIKALQGYPIALITVSMMALIFSSLVIS